MEIRDRRVLLTGATGGLGRAIAKSMASAGSKIVLSSRKAEELDQLASELPGNGHETIVSDLAEEGAAEKLVAEAGDVDVLVANAALAGTGTLESFSSDQVHRALRVNLEAPVLMSQALLEGMHARGRGHIVFISSLSGKVASPRGSIYSATKFGLRGFALALREDQIVDRTGVGVSLVLPGFIRDAGMFADGGAELPPGAGTASPEEVGAAVIRAIAEDKAEVAVAPLGLRIGSSFAHVFPQVSARSQRKVARKVGDQLAAGNIDKR